MSALVLIAVLAASPDARPVHVTIELPPSGCPLTTEFSRRLVYRSERVQLIAETDRAAGWLDVKIAPSATGFEGTLVIRTVEHPADRRVINGKKCETVIDALALSAALLLDPQAKLGPVPAEAPVPEVIVLTPKPEPKPEPKPALPEVVIPNRQPDPTPNGPVITILAQGHITTVASGNTDLGGGLGVELSSQQRWAELFRPIARLGFGIGSGRTLQSTAGEMRYVVHALSRLELGARFLDGPLRPSVGLAMHLLTMEVASLAADDNRRSLRWLPVPTLWAGLSLRLGGWSISAQVDGGAHLVRENYVIDPDGAVFGVPQFALGAQLSVGRSFE